MSSAASEYFEKSVGTKIFFGANMINPLIIVRNNYTAI
jgi:hypothetical protein